MKMKKLLIFFCFLTFTGAIAQNTSPHQHDHPHSPYKPLPNEAVLLKGFDGQAAMREAFKRSDKPAEQQEWFEFLKRKFLAEKVKLQKGNSVNGVTGGNANAKGPQSPTPSPNNQNCPNAGFDYGDYTGWVGGTYQNTAATNWNTFTIPWTNGVMTMGTNTPTQAYNPAFVNPYPNRMTLLTVPPTVNVPPTFVGWDSIAINSTTGLSEIPFQLPTSNGVTCRLGNANNNNNETERLVYSMFVTPQNSQFTYAFAVVIFDGGHAFGEQPFFKISVKDQAGNPIPGCGQYQIDASQVATDTSFHQAGAGFGYYYRKWTTVGLDLNAYLNQNITIEFQTGDCIFGGHWCYAYIDAPGGGCSPAQASVNMCTGSTTATWVAPVGYSNYQWFGPNSMTQIAGATNDSLIINNATVGDVYTVQVISAAGCTTAMQTTLINTNVTIQSVYSSPSCATGFSGSATVIATGSNQGYNYVWTNTSGGSVGTNSATATGLSPGTYSVVVSAPGCGQADTTIQVNISAPVFYTDVQNFCVNPAQITAPAGSNYVWYDQTGNLIMGATAATLTVANPTNNSSFTTVFTNAGGCQDSVKITISQTVNFSTSNQTYCGTSATLCAPTGATNVNWYDANWPYAYMGSGLCYTINNPVASTWSPYYYSYTNPTSGCKDSIAVYLTNIPSSIYTRSI
jgi:hypothetical protein